MTGSTVGSFQEAAPGHCEESPCAYPPASRAWPALVVALLWLVLAGAKLGGGQVAQEVLLLVGERNWAWALSALLVGVEVLLGCLLLMPRGPARRSGTVGSAGLLGVYGLWAIVRQSATCSCAGRLVNLDALGHSLLTGGMLILVSLELRWSTRTASASGSPRRRAPRCAAVLGAAAIFILAVLASEKGAPAPDRQSPDLVGFDNVQAPTLRSVGRIRARDPGAPIEVVPASVLITGRVTDKVTGKPLAGARVGVEGPGPRSTSQGWPAAADTDLTGRFTIRCTHAERGSARHLCCYKQGYVPTGVALPESPSGPDYFAIELDPGLEARGVVLTATGAPMASARVEAWGRCAEEMSSRCDSLSTCGGVAQFSEALTGTDGRFSLSGLTPGLRALRVFPSDGASAVPAVPDRFRPGSNPVVITVPEIRHAGVRVLDSATREFLPQARIVFQLERDKVGPNWFCEHPRASEGVSRKNVFVRGGQDWLSVYDMRAVPNNPLYAEVSAPGYAATTVALTTDQSPGADATVVLLERNGVGALGIARIDAQWPNGRRFFGQLSLLVEGAELSQPSRVQVAITDDSVDLPLPAGRYEILAYGGAGVTTYIGRAGPAVVEVRSGRVSQALIRMTGGGFRVRLVDDETGYPLSHYRINVNPRSARPSGRGSILSRASAHLPPDDPHAATVYWAAPGEYLVSIRKSGYAKASHAVLVPEDGSIVEVDVRLAAERP